MFFGVKKEMKLGKICTQRVKMDIKRTHQMEKITHKMSHENSNDAANCC